MRHVDGTPGFLTNSHCSSVNFGLDNGPYWQLGDADPITNSFLIGNEHLDRGFFDHVQNTQCPTSFRCRYADATFVGFTTTNYALQTLFRTPFGSQTFAYDPIEMVTIAAWPPTVGVGVGKLGQRTGYSEGAVSNSCKDTKDPYDPTILWLCQIWVYGFADDGDSGAAIFTFNTDNYGVAHGLEALAGTTDSGIQVFVGGSMVGIQRDLGTLLLQ